mgnify:CR=1 FL=1
MCVCVCVKEHKEGVCACVTNGQVVKGRGRRKGALRIMMLVL